MPMQDCYSYYYILKTTNKNQLEEVIIDFNEIKEFDEFISELDSYEPSDTVLEKLFKEIDNC